MNYFSKKGSLAPKLLLLLLFLTLLSDTDRPPALPMQQDKTPAGSVAFPCTPPGPPLSPPLNHTRARPGPARSETQLLTGELGRAVQFTAPKFHIPKYSTSRKVGVTSPICLFLLFYFIFLSPPSAAPTLSFLFSMTQSGGALPFFFSQLGFFFSQVGSLLHLIPCDLTYQVQVGRQAICPSILFFGGEGG